MQVATGRFGGRTLSAYLETMGARISRDGGRGSIIRSEENTRERPHAETARDRGLYPSSFPVPLALSIVRHR